MDALGVLRAAAVFMAMSVLVAAVSGRAQGDQGDSAAAALVATLDEDAAHRAITADALAHAKEALERATRFRGTGDEALAKAAEGLAREWAETARDLARAADAEATASNLRRKAIDAQARLERARALVEAGIARIGRLRSELEETGQPAPKDRSAVEIHDGDGTAKKSANSKGNSAHPTTHGQTP